MSKGKEHNRVNDIIFTVQIMSVSFIWFFVIGLTVWIVHILLLSIELKDAPGFSMAISIVAIPVCWILAAVLTYVFVALRRNRKILQ